MAKKKPRHPPGTRGRPKRRATGVPDLPDPRVMETMMRQALGGLVGGDESPELQEAQDLVYQAWEEDDPARQVALAMEALEISPDCADAYVILGNNAPTPQAAVELYEKGVTAGERALGPDHFRHEVGHFWGILETRPYMRARLQLALVLWTSGRRDEAVAHLKEMLRLNPNDNQGVRYTLAGLLLRLDRDDELAALLDQYPDDAMAEWAYDRALLAFRRHGDTPESRRLVKEALKANKHIPAYILGHKQPPNQPTGMFSPGDEQEALNYVGSTLGAWKATPGAVAWLRANTPAARKKESRLPKAKGPTASLKKRIKERLPQDTDVWQVDFRQLSRWVQDDAGDVRPWVMLVASPQDSLLLAHEISDDEPSAPVLWDAVALAMRDPLMGEPHRPAELHVRPDVRWESLRADFEEVGIQLVTAETLDGLDEVFEGLLQHLAGEPEPGLLDVPGITPEIAGSFYEAAAVFFQEAPWRHVGYESAIRIQCEQVQGGPWYALVMGGAGMTFGLTLYEDLDLLRRIWDGDLSNEENADITVATTVTFNEQSEIPVADLDAAERHGWKVAREDAYPSLFHKDEGMSIRPPEAWEVQLMEGCLRAVPDFVRRHRQGDATQESVTVPTGTGELKLTLAWVTD